MSGTTSPPALAMEPLVGIQRIPTEQLIKSIEDAGKLDNANMQWYSPTHSMNSQPPLLICHQVRQDISLLELNKEETDLVCRSWTAITLKNFVNEAKKSTEREAGNAAYEMTRKLVYGAAEFSEQFTEILALVVPSDSEYAIAFGLVAFLFKPLNARVAEEEKIVTQVHRVSELLPAIGYVKDALPTSAMRMAVSGLCSEIITFLRDVIYYHKHRSITKYVMKLVPKATSKFDEHIESISQHVNTIRELQNTASLALQLDSLAMLDQTSKLVVRMYQASQLEAARMQMKLKACYSTIARQSQFGAILHAQKLQQVLLPDPSDTEARSNHIEYERKRLTAGEEWQNHSNEIDFQGWLQSGRRPLLWIHGKHRPDRISWVSPFSVDLNNALSFEKMAAIASVFCDDGSEEYWTAALIIKHIIHQILENHPSLAIDLASILTPWRLEKAGKSALTHIQILDDMLKKMATLPGWETQDFFVLIDRVDLCYPSKGFSVEEDFYPALQRLNQRHSQLHLILTSDQSAEDMDSLDQSKDTLTIISVDTTEGGRMRLR